MIISTKKFYSKGIEGRELKLVKLKPGSFPKHSLDAHSYGSPSSGEAYRDRRLTTNFELWVEIFCVPTCFHMRIPKQCLSVCPHPEKRYHLSFVNMSPTLVIDTSMEWSSRVNPKICLFFSKKFEIWILTFDEELKSP